MDSFTEVHFLKKITNNYMIHAEVITAIKQICDEKGLPLESVISTIESALAAAYRKDFGDKLQNIKVKFDIDKGTFKVYDVKTVMEKPEDFEEEAEELKKEEDKEENKKEKSSPAKISDDKKISKEKESMEDKKEKKEEDKEEAEEGEIKWNPKLHIDLVDAKKIKKTAKLGEELWMELEVPEDFGRMAAQTAKQVIIQKLREAERNAIFDEYKNKEHTLITGVVQRREGFNVLIDLGKTTAIMPREHQIENERYTPNSKYKFYLYSVEQTTKGAEVIVSRAHPGIINELFKMEIPEVAAGTIEIVSIAREAGERSKIAVKSTQENIDPIGSCVGQRGARAQTIISELGGEKIDIIEYKDDPAKFIANALSPAKIQTIKTSKDGKTATAVVKEDQLSLAIGKGGQNVRLAAKLTGWKIDIVSEEKAKENKKEKKEDKKEKEDKNEKSSSAKASEDKEDKKEKKAEQAKDKDVKKEEKKEQKKETKKEEAKESKKESTKKKEPEKEGK